MAVHNAVVETEQLNDFAEHFCAKYRNPEAEYVDPFEVVKRLGISLEYMDFIENDSAAGYVMWDMNNGIPIEPMIFLNSELKKGNPGRLRFKCAHELFHILLYEEDYCCWTSFDPGDPAIKYDEFMVNVLASHLLMPEIPFKKVLYNSKLDFSNIAHKFGTTVEQVVRRTCQGKREFPFHAYASNNNCEVLFSYSFDDLKIGTTVENKYCWSSYRSIKQKCGHSCETDEDGRKFYCTTKRLHSERYITFGAPYYHRYMVDRFMDFPE